MAREAIFIGPCPRCDELVVHFRDRLIGVDRETLLNGTKEAKREHLFNVVCKFLEPFLGKLTEMEEELAEELGADYGPGGFLEDEAGEYIEGQEDRITQKEIDDFINIDLKLIDKKEYFDRIFGSTDQNAGKE